MQGHPTARSLAPCSTRAQEGGSCSSPRSAGLVALPSVPCSRCRVYIQQLCSQRALGPYHLHHLPRQGLGVVLVDVFLLPVLWGEGELGPRASLGQLGLTCMGCSKREFCPPGPVGCGSIGGGSGGACMRLCPLGHVSCLGAQVCPWESMFACECTCIGPPAGMCLCPHQPQA